jgi:hypothetical protein
MTGHCYALQGMLPEKNILKCFFLMVLTDRAWIFVAAAPD